MKVRTRALLLSLSFALAACSDSTQTITDVTSRSTSAAAQWTGDATRQFTIQRPKSSTLGTDSTVQLLVQAASGGRRSMTTVTWSSSDVTRATVSSTTGVVRGRAVGRVYVRAVNSTGRDSVAIDIVALSPFVITGTPTSLFVGAQAQLGSTSTSAVTWTSSNLAVASVSASGVVSGLTAGTSTISARNAASVVSSVLLTVAPTASDPTPPPAPTPPPPPPPTPTPPPAGLSYVQPTAPQLTVSTTYPALTGTSIRVPAGGDLQAALNSAQSGDEIVLAAGATFTGNFVLPVKSGSGWIVVRAATVGTSAGVRMTPALIGGAAKIVSPNATPAITTAPGAARWRLVGFGVSPTSGAGINYGLIVLGRGDETSLSSLPSNVILDRMYIHGTLIDNLSRCVAFNGIALAVIDSWLGECHGRGFDAQGVGGWNGPGPFLIENNRIEGSGQAILFGGADPAIANVSPSDITIRRNYLYKPMSWGNGVWTVKATFELKHGKRVRFEGNVLENHWADAQVGYAILFQTLADNNTSWAWTTVQDVLVQNNLIIKSTSGVNVLARVAYNGGTLPTNPTSRVAIVNNLFQDVGRDPVSGTSGRIFQLLEDLVDVSVVNNTATLSTSANQALSMDGSRPQTRLTFVNNVFPATDYGIFGSGKGMGTNALSFFAPTNVTVGNVLPTQTASVYPANNFFPSTYSSIVFSAPTAGDFSLASSNPFFTGFYGGIGVNYAQLSATIAGTSPMVAGFSMRSPFAAPRMTARTIRR